ncbi:MAG: hypothetical protein K6A23_10095 [Butyrivibrio sp.]|nr:hypothetical protein [Butyrivibrio sp.]
MAENDNNNYIPDDPKLAKAQLKADRKKFKDELKAQKKEQKEREQELAERQAEINGDNGGGIATLLITLLIIIIWLAIMSLLIKMDVGGFGSGVLAPIIGDVPYLNMILPEGSTDQVTINNYTTNISSESTSGASGSDITTIDEANAYIKRLENALKDEMELNSQYAATIEKLEAEVERLEPFEEEQAEFEEQRANFYNSIVYGDSSPDPSVFASYYAMIEPDIAAQIYAQIVSDEVTDEAISEYAKTYSGMKAKAAAAIFDEMVENQDQAELVSKILAKMSSENRGDILAAMTEENAARVTRLLEPSSLEKESTEVTG